ncbi:hypothetical protein L2E82_13970 [Cichorium intybus]|uniref:Uncharacterized protein n=1 Tax=Cichorium intybus TaxID=13427 RepID=A0ACB9EYQ8_CICIN|nr:hypothetical protein L2E82_13970 [Cichorium intybus]
MMMAIVNDGDSGGEGSNGGGSGGGGLACARVWLEKQKTETMEKMKIVADRVDGCEWVFRILDRRKEMKGFIFKSETETTKLKKRRALTAVSSAFKRKL